MAWVGGCVGGWGGSCRLSTALAKRHQKTQGMTTSHIDTFPSIRECMLSTPQRKAQNEVTINTILKSWIYKHFHQSGLQTWLILRRFHMFVISCSFAIHLKRHIHIEFTRPLQENSFLDFCWKYFNIPDHLYTVTVWLRALSNVSSLV